MEFKGRISRLFEARRGVSVRTGQPWKALPFVFEFFEQEEDRYSSFVKLETFNTDIMAKIAPFIAKGEDGKAIIKDGCMELTKNVEVKCNFRLNISLYNGRVYNEVVLREMEVLTEADKEPTAPAAEVQKQGDSFADLQPAEAEDELPF
jgi:hypothetical protein